MFFVAGVSPKLSKIGGADAYCPVCMKNSNLFIVKQSQALSVFFIPVLKFSAEYIATCGSCASVMELDKEAGRRFEREGGCVSPHELRVIRNNSGPVCPGCGIRVQQDHRFCPGCGNRL